VVLRRGESVCRAAPLSGLSDTRLGCRLSGVISETDVAAWQHHPAG